MKLRKRPPWIPLLPFYGASPILHPPPIWGHPSHHALCCSSCPCPFLLTISTSENKHLPYHQLHDLGNILSDACKGSHIDPGPWDIQSASFQSSVGRLVIPLPVGSPLPPTPPAPHTWDHTSPTSLGSDLGKRKQPPLDLPLR